MLIAVALSTKCPERALSPLNFRLFQNYDINLEKQKSFVLIGNNFYNKCEFYVWENIIKFSEHKKCVFRHTSDILIVFYIANNSRKAKRQGK